LLFFFSLRMGTLLLADPTKKSNVHPPYLPFKLFGPENGLIDMDDSRQPQGRLVDYKEPHELEQIMDFSLPDFGVGPEGMPSLFVCFSLICDFTGEMHARKHVSSVPSHQV
jgi:hypothetical protein